MCDSAGVMYWGDVNNAGLSKIETAYLDGTGRRPLLEESNADYVDFVLHDGDLYFTDWNDLFVCSLSSHFSNFIGYLSNGLYRLSWVPLPIVLSIGTSLYLWLPSSVRSSSHFAIIFSAILHVQSLALISISIHTCFILQLQQRRILSFPPFVSNTSRKHLKTHLFSASDSLCER